MSKTTWIALLSLAVLPVVASAQDRQDANGPVRPSYERSWGEPLEEKPAWARGRGYWDRRDPYGVTPPWYEPFQLPDGYYRSYAPAPNWRGDRETYDGRREAFKDRMQDRRERLKDRRGDQLQRMQNERERQLNPYRYVR